jgi:mannosyltransferase OCH1-like enzyme
MYVYGGVYVDLDYVCLRSFDVLAPLLADNGTNVSSVITNSFMMSRAPGNPFWMECILDMLNNRPSPMFGKHWAVLNTTGPFMLTRCVKKDNRGRIDVRSDVIVPCNVCKLDACNVPQRDSAASPYTVLLPTEGSSWVSWDTKLINFGFCNWVPLSIFATVLAACVTWWARSRGQRRRSRTNDSRRQPRT